MATVFRKTFTKPLPAGAEMVARNAHRLARWRDAKGRARTAPATAGGSRIVLRARTYTAKFRNAQGHIVEKATGCHDKVAAEALLSQWVRRAEHVKSKIMAAAEDAIADHQSTPIQEHLDAYFAHLAAEMVRCRRVSHHHRVNVEHNLQRVVTECRFCCLADITRSAVQKWLVGLEAGELAPRTRNTHRAAIVAFCNWCVASGRVSANPLTHLCAVDESGDRRRQRRALTEAELVRLLDAARRRPSLEARTVRRGSNRGKPLAKIRPEVKEQLEVLGMERSLIYKTLVLTGLRKAELASLTAGQLELDEPSPYAVLRAVDEKNAKGSVIPLRHDLAADLQHWLATKLERQRKRAQTLGQPLPSCLSPGTPLFAVPAGLIRILDRDLALAGIPKRDARGRTVDVHALRTTFGTHLSRGGVAPRTAQAAMRHSSIDETMNLYTDERLLDVAGALTALPTLPLERIVGSGMGGRPPSQLAPMLAPDSDDPVHAVAEAGNSGSHGGQAGSGRAPHEKAENPALRSDSRPSCLERATRIELATFSLGS